MYDDPTMALQFAKERQAQLRQEATTDHLEAEWLRERRRPFLLRLSNALVYSGLWLRSRVEREPRAEAIPSGRWHAMPLVMLRLAGGYTTAASLQRWPIYTFGAMSMANVARTSGYAIVPAAWLPRAELKQLPS